MAITLQKSKGYSCEVLDAVPENSVCHSCKLLARKLTFTSCCGESYCHAFLSDQHQQGQPCPACEAKGFSLVVLAKHRKQIEALKVRCSMKERGCGWTGTVGQLDTHLDPDQDKCQYVDTKCPLKCQQVVPKNKVEEHVAQHCSKRPHVCQHCGFKGSYEEVVERHLQECKYVPLQCSNLCGVSCEREDMEDHLKICRLQEVKCGFEDVGCREKFPREDLEDHMQGKILGHLLLTASSLVVAREGVSHQLREQSKLLEDQKMATARLEKKLEESDKEAALLKARLEAIEKESAKELEQSSKDKEELERKLSVLEVKVQQDRLNQAKQLWWTWKGISSGTDKRFEIDHLSEVRARHDGSEKDWKCPSIHTHLMGYKFCMGVAFEGKGNADVVVRLKTYAVRGIADEQLKWPAWIKFSVEILNHSPSNEGNTLVTLLFSDWSKPEAGRMVLREPDAGLDAALIKLSDLEDYLLNDTMFFHIRDILVISNS